VIALLAKDKTIPALALAVMFSITLTLDLIPVESFTQDEEASRQLQQLGETFQSNR
jgi:cell division protein ZapA (FtsZ GTPase activity inhibitor)